MADADTLRLVARSLPMPIDGFDYVPYPDSGSIRCAVSLHLWTRGHFDSTERALVDDALWSARAAFRACPGLRG